jgi:signal transduction histidine kinase
MAQSDRLAHWVGQYLTLAPDEAEGEPADLPSVLATVRANHATELERHGIAWEEDVAPGLAPLGIAAGPLEQVLNGLVTNAIQAMAGGGRITATTRPAGRCRVELRIADTGRGMSEEQLARAFTPFMTTKPSGLGLGLSLARRIVERHGGRITLESAPSIGTTAILTLPTKE